MLNAAVIGLGWWGKTITDRMQASTEMRITRAVDLFPEKQGDYTARYGVPVTGDYAEVLADPAIHAVILTTPNSLHTQQIAAAAHAGKHVFCEKPMALTLADAEAILRAFTRRAFRRPVTEDDLQPILARVRTRLDAGDSFERAVRVGLLGRPRLGPVAEHRPGSPGNQSLSRHL